MHLLKRENRIFPDLGVDSLKKWIIAIRPNTLFASISPVIIGTSMAYGDKAFHLPSALAAAIGAVFIQIGTNLANDYYDYIHGVDRTDRIGPVRVTQAGIIEPGSVKKGFIIAFFIAVLSGIYLIWRAGIPILIIGIVSILSGIAYTAGPFPLGYYGLGEPFVIIFFGPVAVSGTYYVQALDINKYVLISGLAPGFISNAILIVNNLRDIKTDKKAGKKTLAVRFGKKFAKIEYILSLFFAFIVPFYLVLSGCYYHLFACISFLLSIPCIKTILIEEPGLKYNKVLKKTSLMLFVYSVVFSLGWIKR